MWTLTIEDEEGTVRTHALAGDACTLGRSGTCDLVLHDRTISRRHARLERRSTRRWYLHDEGSRYGCYVNGQRVVGETRVGPLDVVQLGSLCLGLAADEFDTTESTGERLSVPTPVPWNPQLAPTHLLVFEGPDTGRKLVLGPHTLNIGVGEPCGLTLPYADASPGVHAVVRPLPGGRYEVLRTRHEISLLHSHVPIERMLLDDGDLLRFVDAAGKHPVALRFVTAKRVRMSTLGTPVEGWRLHAATRSPVAEAELDAAPTLAEVEAWWAVWQGNWRACLGHHGTSLHTEKLPLEARGAAGAAVPGPVADPATVNDEAITEEIVPPTLRDARDTEEIVPPHPLPLRGEGVSSSHRGATTPRPRYAATMALCTLLALSATALVVRAWFQHADPTEAPALAPGSTPSGPGASEVPNAPATAAPPVSVSAAVSPPAPRLPTSASSGSSATKGLPPKGGRGLGDKDPKDPFDEEQRRRERLQACKDRGESGCN